MIMAPPVANIGSRVVKMRRYMKGTEAVARMVVDGAMMDEVIWD